MLCPGREWGLPYSIILEGAGNAVSIGTRGRRQALLTIMPVRLQRGVAVGSPGLVNCP